MAFSEIQPLISDLTFKAGLVVASFAFVVGLVYAQNYIKRILYRSIK